MKMHKITPIRQNELSECGYACLAMVLSAYKIDTNLAAMRNYFKPSARGTTLRTLMSAADDVGLIPRAIKLPVTELDDLHLPAILHWDASHYVVLEHIKSKKYLVHDPANGSILLNKLDVSKHFTGVALELRPSGIFTAPIAEPALKIRQLWTRLNGANSAALQIVTLGIIGEILAISLPYFLQIGVDIVLPSRDINLLFIIGLSFLVISILSGVILYLKSSILTSVGAGIGFGLIINLARHLLRLPIEWHKRRLLGDVVGRLNSTNYIQNTLTKGTTIAVVDGLFGILVFAVMAAYSFKLTFVSAMAVACSFFTKLYLSRRQNDAEQEAIIALGTEQSTIIECLRGITSIRMQGKERDRHAVWQQQRSNVTNSQVIAANTKIKGDSISSTIAIFETVIVIWIGLYLVINESMTLGMLFAFLALRTIFWNKAQTLVEQASQLVIFRLHLNRIADIALSSEDESFIEKRTEHVSNIRKVELINVSHRYAPSDPYVINNVNLVINQGDHVAITGQSGGGKTTLLMIILGLLKPTEGMVLINNVDLKDFGVRNYHQTISSVLQDDFLFTGTISDNITMFDSNPDYEKIRQSAQMACISTDIEKMPLKYHTLVGDMSTTLSSGQRQRIIIARMIYRTPSFIVTDEATSHLDADTEKTITNNIEGLNITRLTVAHREETLRNASSRYRLSNGSLVKVKA